VFFPEIPEIKLFLIMITSVSQEVYCNHWHLSVFLFGFLCLSVMKLPLSLSSVFRQV